MIKNGIDNRAGLSVLKGKRLGLITNPTGVDGKLRYTADVLAEQFDLVALFGPEHGIRGDMQAGENTDSVQGRENGIPVFSLYGRTKRLTDDMLDGVEAVVYDIQDVGARFYTYTCTMAYAMEECAARNIPFIVLDRYNPIGCSLCEGMRMDRKLDSFVGAYGLTARYAMTPGMLARYIKDRYAPGCSLDVVECIGLRKDTMFPGSGLQWVMPSPNMPAFETALAFIGTCIFEGTNISEGRGTTRPFELVGAPFLDAASLAGTLNSYNVPGVLFREAHFIPTFHKHAGELCHGVQLHVTDAAAFRPFKAGALLFQEICRQSGSRMEYNLPHFDRIAGSDVLRLNCEDVSSVLEIAEHESTEFFRETEIYREYNYGA